MQSSHFLLYFFIYDPVVGNRTFPAHTTDQPDRSHIFIPLNIFFILLAQPLVFPCVLVHSRIPRIRALLPAFAGGTFVNGPRKTNATFGIACFSFGLIKSYTQVPRAFALHCLLSQAEPSLMVQEKQMPPSVSLVFLLDSLHLILTNPAHSRSTACLRRRFVR